MKKLLLAAAVAALSTVAAQAAPTVYGKAFLTVDLHEGDVAKAATTERTQLNSNGSRIGFKGSEALSPQTDLVYQLEYGVRVDDNSANFTSRNTYLGLANKQFGTVLAGRLLPIDDMVNYANVTAGGVLGGDDILGTTLSRANNAIAYVSPNYNGLNFLGMYVLDEKTDMTAEYAAGLVPNNGTDSYGRDVFGVGAKYETDAFNAGATYIQRGDFKVARVSGSYNVTPAITAGALYQIADDGDEKENALTVSGTYKVAQTPWTAYSQVDLVDNYGNEKDAEAQRLVIGGKYGFNKNTTGHVYGSYLKADDKDGIGIGAGIEYKF